MQFRDVPFPFMRVIDCPHCRLQIKTGEELGATISLCEVRVERKKPSVGFKKKREHRKAKKQMKPAAGFTLMENIFFCL
jgi:hypothetical protein